MIRFNSSQKPDDLPDFISIPNTTSPEINLSGEVCCQDALLKLDWFCLLEKLWQLPAAFTSQPDIPA